MVMITRCPACRTAFKVVPDQLRIATGWVRCGHCGKLFDGEANLLAPDSLRQRTANAEATQDSSAPPAAEPAAREPPRAPETRDLTIQPEAPTPPEPWIDAPGGNPLDGVAPTAEEQPHANRAEPRLHQPDADAPEPLVLTDRLDFEFSVPPTSVEIDDPVLSVQAERAMPRVAHTYATPSFVSASRQRAFWDNRAVRISLWVAAFMLAALLAVQWALYNRDWLAARAPPTMPVLAALCRPLGCAIEPYRMLDAIAIDGSDFRALGANTFRFDLSLRNGADLAVATPAFELTLTDAQGQPLLRRVLLSGDLDAPAALAAHGRFDTTRTLQIGDAAQPADIANYQVRAFYP